MSVDCGRTSLKGLPCVKPANHDGNHRQAEGKEWPEGQSWQELANDYWQSLGFSRSETRGEWNDR